MGSDMLQRLIISKFVFWLAFFAGLAGASGINEILGTGGEGAAVIDTYTVLNLSPPSGEGSLYVHYDATDVDEDGVGLARFTVTNVGSDITRFDAGAGNDFDCRLVEFWRPAQWSLSDQFCHVESDRLNPGQTTQFTVPVAPSASGFRLRIEYSTTQTPAQPHSIPVLVDGQIPRNSTRP